MATAFHFRAVAPDGKMRNGTLQSESERLAIQELRRQGLTPVYVGTKGQGNLDLRLPSLGGGGRRKDVLYFTQELSTLLNAGIPLDRALAITAELSDRASFRGIVSDILRVLKGGRSLGDSLATKPEYFSELYVNMVRAGEASGALAPVFERLAEFERTRDDLRNYILSALAYPALLFVVGVASIVFLLTFVVPRFAAVFEESNLAMPMPTRIMLESSQVLQQYGLIAAGVIILALLILHASIRSPAGRLRWDSFRLKLPVLGDALRKAEVSRFARAMSTLVANSVPLVQSLSIAGATLNNKRISNALGPVAQGVKRGEGIAAPLRKTGEFPPLASHLLLVGEETGRLDTMFARMADIYETETRTSIKRFTSLFEPIVILVMGIIVGALILSMLMAITSINEVAI